jgi:redox-sensitive bicupin YhaK (pirin superfamily)
MLGRPAGRRGGKHAGFFHHDSAALPLVSDAGRTVRVVAGSAYGERSPVATAMDTLLVDDDCGSVAADRCRHRGARDLSIGEVDTATVSRRTLARSPRRRHHGHGRKRRHFVLLGGAAMDGPRHIWWNFVLAQGTHRAGQGRLKAARFDTVPGDDKEFVLLLIDCGLRQSRPRSSATISRPDHRAAA